ncbi:hypothetical protein ATE84_3241 [Aquimarina sp. MAR_2010_214]|uniref:hypothetical protein n=1 Tax=Aquimarina sp. MAR_2010_214 TaxID=1250026 RepID=UPI000C705269|nr:hypothetical protein [Aquimarina sp. MAR_2010_214]PKV51169.1 hypothetical protein ATE84_3241 [Aquimarina sp. MAR_2010_214]
MKAKYIVTIIIIILFANIMTGQIRFTEEELRIFKERVTETRALGRAGIIAKAAKAASDDPESLIHDKNVLISVWYNDIEVKVEFIEHSPVRYIPYDSKCVTNMEVYVSTDGVSGSSSSDVYESEGYVSDFSKPIYLYRSTKEKELMIDKVLKLNNTTDDVPNIDKSIYTNIIIREQKDHYAIQIGSSYPITYKIKKKSGELYDYEDPYRDLYPTPDIEYDAPPPIGGEWIEMKE